MTDRSASVVFGIGLSCAVVAAGLLDRARGGIESHYLAFAFLLSGPALWQWLHFRGRLPSPLPRVHVALPLVGFGGAFTYPFAAWGVCLGAISAFLIAMRWLSEKPSPPAARSDEALVVLLGVANVAILWLAANRAEENVAVAILLACSGLEAWGPRSSRTIGDAVRRAATLSLLGGSTLLHFHVGDELMPIMSTELLLLLLAAIATVSACMDAEGRHERSEGPVG